MQAFQPPSRACAVTLFDSIFKQVDAGDDIVFKAKLASSHANPSAHTIVGSVARICGIDMDHI